MRGWDRRAEVGLALLSAVFLVAYGWPIVEPQLDRGWRHACEVTLWVTWVAFAAEYAVRLARAERRLSWLVRHPLDLAVLLLPMFRPLRLLRLVTLLRVLNRSAMVNLRGRVGLYIASGSVILATTSALAVLDAERRSPRANISSFGDALWWACTTMTTVGYGDRYPVTTQGRLVAVGLMVAGIGLLGTVTATLASWLIEAVRQDAASSPAAVEQDLLVAEVAALRAEVARLASRMEAPPAQR